VLALISRAFGVAIGIMGWRARRAASAAAAPTTADYTSR
jgi:hypothetical protein